MWEEFEEWWGKKLVCKAGFFRGVVTSLRNAWYIFEDGEVIARGIGESIKETQDSVETRMAALCGE